MEPRAAMPKKYSDDERKELAQKLDKEFDEFISKLEKKSSNEAWPECRWQEEMEKHPFFMTKLPESGEVPPLLKGLQDLKYSPEENNPEELAQAYKDDGNFHYKLNKYRMAVLCYTEGLKQRSANNELNGQLYNNRAASHFFLGNFRSCYNDCKSALKALPHHDRARKRLAFSCLKLGLIEECLFHCKELEKCNQFNTEISKLAQEAKKQKEKHARDERKTERMLRKNALVAKELQKAIEERGITLVECGGAKEAVDDGTHTCEIISNIYKNSIIDSHVHLENDRLVWPILLLYPEYETSDVIQNFMEDNTFEDELLEVFKSYAEWDVNKNYSLNNVNLYYENPNKKIILVNKKSTLGSVLSKKDFRIENGMPTFLVILKSSALEKKLLKVNHS